MDEKMLTVEEVASRLGFSIETVRRFIKFGVNGHKLTASKMGREYRIKPSDLGEFVKKLSKAA